MADTAEVKSIRPVLSSKWVDPPEATKSMRRFRGLLYGDFGQGKTTLTGKILAAIGGNSLVVSTDSNWVVLLDNPALEGKLKQVPFRSYGNGFQQWMDIAIRYGDATEVQNLVFDTASDAIDTVKAHWVKTKKFSDQKHPDVAGWTHYDLVKNYLVDVIRPLKNTKLNIIYIAHTKEPSQADLDKGKRTTRPNAPEQSYKVLARECNLVGWCHKEKRGEAYQIQTEGTVENAAKSQVSTIPQALFKQDEIPAKVAEWLNQK